MDCHSPPHSTKQVAGSRPPPLILNLQPKRKATPQVAKNRASKSQIMPAEAHGPLKADVVEEAAGDVLLYAYLQQPGGEVSADQ